MNQHIFGTAAALLIPLAEKAEVFPPYWIDCDMYCLDCAEKVEKRLIAEGEDPDEICIDGGDGWPEEGDLRCCGDEDCGRLLQYILINRSSELDHFEALSDNSLRKMSPNTAHEFIRVLEGSSPERHAEEDERRTSVQAMRIIELLGDGTIKDIDGVLAAWLLHTPGH